MKFQIHSLFYISHQTWEKKNAIILVYDEMYDWKLEVILMILQLFKIQIFTFMVLWIAAISEETFIM